MDIGEKALNCKHLLNLSGVFLTAETVDFPIRLFWWNHQSIVNKSSNVQHSCIIHPQLFRVVKPKTRTVYHALKSKRNSITRGIASNARTRRN